MSRIEPKRSTAVFCWRAKRIALSAACLAFVGELATAATFDASYFGFSTNAADNFSAMRALERYANSNGTVSVTFKPGTYVVRLPVSGNAGYRGLMQGACMMTNVTGAVIDAAVAEFYCTNLNGSGQSIFQLRSCTNVSIKAQFRGAHTGSGSGIKAVHLISNNRGVALDIKTAKMFDGVRIGDYEDPAATPKPLYTGNRDITVVATNTDTTYGVVACLANNVTITNQSFGTSANSFGAHRAVYVSGSSNVIAHSWSRDLNVPDGCNLITSAPSAVSPHHFGCSNVTLYATDLGSTYFVKYQSLVKLGVVSSSVSATNIQHKQIQLHVVAPSTATVRTNQYTVAIGSLGAAAAHVFEYVSLSGIVERGPSNTQPSVYVESTITGLSRLELALDRFHDASAATRYSLFLASTVPSAFVTAIDSTLNLVYLAAPSKQRFLDLGKRLARPASPSELRVVHLVPP